MVEPVFTRYFETCDKKFDFIITIVFIIATKETIVRRCSVKKAFLETAQKSQENTCVRVSFSIKL